MQNDRAWKPIYKDFIEACLIDFYTFMYVHSAIFSVNEVANSDDNIYFNELVNVKQKLLIRCQFYIRNII